MNAQPTPEEARFSAFLRSPIHARAYEARFAPGAEGTGSTGGYTVPQRFLADVVHQMRESQTLLKAYELWESEHGEVTNRPTYAQFATAGSSLSENTQVTANPAITFAQQAWPLAPTYSAEIVVSNQLLMDAFRYPDLSTGNFGASGIERNPNSVVYEAEGAPVINGYRNDSLDALIASNLGEALGRSLAPVAQTALYSTISGVGASSGQNGGYLSLTAATAVTFSTGATTELAANTINLDTAAQMLTAVDAAYLDGAAYYFSQAQWAGLIRQVDAQKHINIDPGLGLQLYGFPVILTSQTDPAVASTVSGPVFGNLRAALTLRIAGGGFVLLRSHERYAEFLQTAYIGALRADVQTRDARAVVGVRYAAT
jgi:hypothetical protein